MPTIGGCATTIVMWASAASPEASVTRALIVCMPGESIE